MSRHYGVTRFSILFLAMIILFGCKGEKRPEGFPKLYPCSIRVTQDNEPLANANLILYADTDEYDRWSVGGTTNEQGVATIVTNGKFTGAPQGSFTVVITKESQEKRDVAPSGSPEPEFVFGKACRLVAKDYGAKETSPARVTVKGRTTAQIDVGPAVHEVIDE
ncbi:MAG: hypothetical protein Q4G68_08665 [Planctomycetia bacterium]|nr:hypothetical protein [Planctomycetia bacterium]